MSTKIKIVPFQIDNRDDMLFMIMSAKNAMGHDPKINEDLLDIKKYYFDRGDMFFVALTEIGGRSRVVGSIGYSRFGSTDEAFIHRLYVHPDLKHMGIGSELLKTAEASMLGKGITVAKVHLGSPKEEFPEAYSFYPKHGYSEYIPCYLKKQLDEQFSAEPEKSDEREEHKISTEDFSLSLRTHVFVEDIALPVNGTLLVEVKSGSFAGRSEMDIDYKWFNIFASKLVTVYSTCNGEASISEPYGNKQFLSFKGDGMGHMTIKGYLCGIEGDFTHELRFENIVDQTELREFVSALSKSCAVN